MKLHVMLASGPANGEILTLVVDRPPKEIRVTPHMWGRDEALVTTWVYARDYTDGVGIPRHSKAVYTYIGERRSAPSLVDYVVSPTLKGDK